MRKILMIATGGTIASTSTSHGLAPNLLSAEILKYVPSVYEICDVETIQLFNIDSTNMTPAHWLQIAAAIEAHYDRYDGFVILHGTDTMSYTAAALSYLIQNGTKPIVLTGSQRPIEKEITDAKRNLYESFLYASDQESKNVNIIFDGHIICGTRARKSRSHSFNAFSSINFPDIAVIRNHKIIRYIKDNGAQSSPVFYHHLNDRVFLLKLIPGMKADIFDYIKNDYDAVIFDSFGAGGLPKDAQDSFMQAVRRWINSDKIIVMSTQVPHEGSDMAVYDVGFQLKEQFELLEAYDMTMEAVVTKLMWILGQTRDKDEIRRMFYTPVNYDTINVYE